MKKTQTLKSGIKIRQDFRDSVRMVLFETPFDGWEYATDGGTIFVVNFRNQIYGLTCVHNRHDFNWAYLAVTETKFGETVAGFEAIYFPSNPKKDAIGSDIEDIAVIKFSPDCDSKFFKDTAYVIDEKTIGISRPKDNLLISGNLKDNTNIGNKIIQPEFCLLEVSDIGATSSDPILREARGKFEDPNFNNVVGISGAPVFNSNRNLLCGMVCRAGMEDNICTVWYMDIVDVIKVLESVHNQQLEVFYQKSVKKHKKNK